MIVLPEKNGIDDGAVDLEIVDMATGACGLVSATLTSEQVQDSRVVCSAYQTNRHLTHSIGNV